MKNFTIICGLLMTIAFPLYGDEKDGFKTIYINYAYIDPTVEVLEATLDNEGNYYIDNNKKPIKKGYEAFKEKLSYSDKERFPSVDLLIDINKLDTDAGIALFKWCQWSKQINLPYRIFLVSDYDRQPIRFNAGIQPCWRVYINDWNQITLKEENKLEALISIDEILKKSNKAPLYIEITEAALDKRGLQNFYQLLKILNAKQGSEEVYYRVELKVSADSAKN